MKGDRLAEVVRDPAWHFEGAATEVGGAVEHAALLGWETRRLMGDLAGLMPNPIVVRIEQKWCIFVYRGVARFRGYR